MEWIWHVQMYDSMSLPTVAHRRRGNKQVQIHLQCNTLPRCKHACMTVIGKWVTEEL